MKYKLQVEEKKNEGLQVTLDETVRWNTQMLKDKEQQEAAHQLMKCKIQELEALNQEMQRKLQDMESKNQSLHTIFDEAQQWNAQMLKEKEQQEATQQQLESKLEVMEKKHE